MRDEMRRVWYSRWYDMAEALVQDMRVGLRSLMRAKGLAATVVITLALGIGANAAIFSVVRGVLMRPLVNRGEERLVYIRQSAPGLGVTSVTFSVPEIKDIRERATTIEAFGEFSTVEFTLVGLGEPRVVQAGVVDGHYFDVVGLRATIGRLIEPSDEGLKAAGVAVLTNRFWTKSLNSDPSVVGKTIQLGTRSATVIGVLEPSVPYPADTEIIANMVTSPHHMGAQMITMRTHRMTQLFGRLQAGKTIDDARSELSAIHSAIKTGHPESYPRALPTCASTWRRCAIRSPRRRGRSCWCCSPPAAVVFIIACSNVANLILARSVRREGELAVRAALGASRAALRRTLLAESLVLCGAGAVLGVLLARPMVAIVASFAARFSVRALEVTVDSSLLWVGASLAMAAAVLLAYVPRLPVGRRIANRQRTGRRQHPHHAGHQSPPEDLRHDAGGVLVRAARRRGDVARDADRASRREHRLRHGAGAGDRPADAERSAPPPIRTSRSTSKVTQRIAEMPGVEGVSMGSLHAVARCRKVGAMPASRSARMDSRPRTARRTRAPGSGSWRPTSST